MECREEDGEDRRTRCLVRYLAWRRGQSVWGRREPDWQGRSRGRPEEGVPGLQEDCPLRKERLQECRRRWFGWRPSFCLDLRGVRFALPS